MGNLFSSVALLVLIHSVSTTMEPPAATTVMTQPLSPATTQPLSAETVQPTETPCTVFLDTPNFYNHSHLFCGSNGPSLCNEYEGRNTLSSFPQIRITSHSLGNNTIGNVRAIADNLAPLELQPCVDMMLHILCIAAAPPCNRDTCLPMRICKRSCDVFKRIKAINFCKRVEDHIRLVADTVDYRSIPLLINDYFNFDCEDPSTYFFTNIPRYDPNVCTDLFSNESLCALPFAVDFVTCGDDVTEATGISDPGLVLAILLPVVVFEFFIISCLICYIFHRKRSKHTEEKLQELAELNTNNVNGNLSKHLSELKDVSIPHEMIVLGDVLGQGAFGTTFKGQYRTENGTQTVAIKTLKNLASHNEFLLESAIMKDFHHPHVLGLVGVVFDAPNGTPYLVLPFMELGDLKKFLKSKRMEDSNNNELPEGLELSNLVKMCIDIAQGMKYLAEKKFVHRDLAARNCMVGKDLLVKVGDFGLARDICSADYRRSSDKDAKIPIKWMPPEAFNDKISNEKTDVWSYGVTCWEVFSLGRTPYPTVPNNEIFNYISSGQRLEKPLLCPDEMFEFMENCWELKPEDRPNFSQLVENLTEYWDIEYGYVINSY